MSSMVIEIDKKSKISADELFLLKSTKAFAEGDLITIKACRSEAEDSRVDPV